MYIIYIYIYTHISHRRSIGFPAPKQQRSGVQLSERRASLGIMGARLRAPETPIGPSLHSIALRHHGGPIEGP